MWAGSMKAILALWELRLKREEEIVNLVAELKLRDHLCQGKHSGRGFGEKPQSDQVIHKEKQARYHARKSLAEPHSVLESITKFFGMRSFPSLGLVGQRRDGYDFYSESQPR